MFTYLGSRVSAGNTCDFAVAARTGFELVKYMECEELLYERKFLLKLNDLDTKAAYGKKLCMVVKHET